MIQRIQTLHLIAATLIGIVAFVLNLTADEQSAVSMTFSGDIAVLYYFYVALIAIGFVLAFWSIFLFKTRMRQIRMVEASALAFLLACVVYVVAYCINLPASSLASIAIYLPVLSVVFDFWARKRIRFDENLVRSADRLR